MTVCCVFSYAKGNYYALTGKSPFSRLVYPVPEKGTAGLGVHATIDLAGQTRFGPDVEWLTDAAAEQISGPATSKINFRTVSHGFLSSTPPPTRRVGSMNLLYLVSMLI